MGLLNIISERLGRLFQPKPEPVSFFAGPPADRIVKRFLPGNGRNEWFSDLPGAPEMVIVPAGSFWMGNGMSTARCHRVKFAFPFAIGRHAITVGQFRAFVEATGYTVEPGAVVLEHVQDKGFDGWYAEAIWSRPGFSQTDNHPVTCVNWHDAAAYVGWLSRATGQSYRLPSEAEWEYVCLAGARTRYWCGSSITERQANVHRICYDTAPFDAPRIRTMPVNSFDPNSWGLYNVHGNVDELCADSWHDSQNYNRPPADGSAWVDDDDARVIRGGHWQATWHDARTRWPSATGQRVNTIGFRVARDLVVKNQSR